MFIFQKYCNVVNEITVAAREKRLRERILCETEFAKWSAVSKCLLKLLAVLNIEKSNTKREQFDSFEW